MSKLCSRTSKTKAGTLFWNFYCATCSPVYVILYHVTVSCKGPIVDSLLKILVDSCCYFLLGTLEKLVCNFSTLYNLGWNREWPATPLPTSFSGSLILLPSFQGVVRWQTLGTRLCFCFLKSRLHRRFLSHQLDAIFVAAKSHQVSNMFETSAISRRQIALKIAPGLQVRF